MSSDTAQTVGSIALVSLLVLLAGLFSRSVNRKARYRGQLLLFWLIFDSLIHIFLEGPFVYLSLFGRTVDSSTGFYANVWKEYSLADRRWGVADPGVVAVELLTVVGTGTLALYTAKLVLHQDARYHFWLCFLCICELYGDYMTFVPEWLQGSPSLDTNDPLHLWFYLVFSNGVWVVIPMVLLWHSSAAILSMLSSHQGVLSTKKNM